MRQIKKQNSEIKVFIAFITDIEKALYLNLNIDSLMLLFKHYCHKLKFFQPSEVKKFSPFQSSDINHRIEFK